MPDLVDKFFKEDLTEAEQRALSNALLNSDETALKFEARARKFYLALGLLEVEAHWPKHGNPPWHASHGGSVGHVGLFHHLGHLSHWIWPAIFAVGSTSVVIAWHFSQKVKARVLPPPAALAIPVVPVEKTLKSYPISKPPVLPKVTPVDAGGGVPQTFSKLSVVVGQAKAGVVTVWVLEPGGKEIAVLYNGELKPGAWAFQWDGKLADGSPAAAGYYRIEIKTGSFIQHKIIQIQ